MTTRRFRTPVLGFLAIALAMSMGRISYADFVYDSVNATATPFAGHYDTATDVGWFYKPTSSYTLDEILTKFSTAYIDGRTITVEIHAASAANPASIGAILGSDSFVPVGGVFEGGSFSPVSLTAGQEYFVGFRNVSGFSFNVTQDPGAVSLGPIYVDTDHSGKYNGGSDPPNYFTSQPILEFLGPSVVPEPSTIIMSGTALIVGLALSIHRRRT